MGPTNNVNYGTLLDNLYQIPNDNKKSPIKQATADIKKYLSKGDSAKANQITDKILKLFESSDFEQLDSAVKRINSPKAYKTFHKLVKAMTSAKEHQNDSENPTLNKIRFIDKSAFNRLKANGFSESELAQKQPDNSRGYYNINSNDDAIKSLPEVSGNSTGYYNINSNNDTNPYKDTIKPQTKDSRNLTGYYNINDDAIKNLPKVNNIPRDERPSVEFFVDKFRKNYQSDEGRLEINKEIIAFGNAAEAVYFLINTEPKVAISIIKSFCEFIENIAAETTGDMKAWFSPRVWIVLGATLERPPVSIVNSKREYVYSPIRSYIKSWHNSLLKSNQLSNEDKNYFKEFPFRMGDILIERGEPHAYQDLVPTSLEFEKELKKGFTARKPQNVSDKIRDIANNLADISDKEEIDGDLNWQYSDYGLNNKENREAVLYLTQENPVAATSIMKNYSIRIKIPESIDNEVVDNKKLIGFMQHTIVFFETVKASLPEEYRSQLDEPILNVRKKMLEISPNVLKMVYDDNGKLLPIEKRNLLPD